MRSAYLQLGVVALLAFGGSGPGCPGKALNARDQVVLTRDMLNQVGQALETYSFNIGHYPTDEEGGLDALLHKPSYADEAMAANWHGPYLLRAPLDPWGNLLKYELNQAGATDPNAPPFVLWSVGPDGQDGTEDDIIYGH